jgi:hypothetical protein
MHRKILSLLPILAAAILIILALSCEKDNPVGSGTTQLTASENPVVLSMVNPRYITISGGQGPCSVKSISDSSVVDAYVIAYQVEGPLVLVGKALGTAVVTVQDSAQTAEVEISVTVANLAASPANVTVRVGKTQYVSLEGGSQPYAIDVPADSTIAGALLGSSYVIITGNAPGSTSLVVRDAASPPNTVAISITVTPRPVLTTSGKISFSSGAGDFSAEGVLSDAQVDIRTVPVNSQAAGGMILPGPVGANYGAMLGYWRRSQNTADAVVIVFSKSNLSQGQVPIDTLPFNGDHKAMVEFVLGGDLNSDTPDTYVMHAGTFTFTTLNSQKATGTFSGAATLTINNVPVAGRNTSVTNGTFDVPLMEDDSGVSAPNAERQRLAAFAEKLIKKHLVQLKSAGAK